jgi:MYXO-CTERM domain-containing protein
MWLAALPAPLVHADPTVIVAPATPKLFAPNIPSGTWPATALPVPFVLALPRSRDVGAAAAAELDVALRAWPHAACTAWSARFDGERAGVAADDGVNVVVFHDDAWPAELVPGAVAQTVVRTDASGRYRDADIHINGVDFRFSLDGAPGTLDLRSILVHELGHALGLGHSTDPRATMFATGSGLRWRSLEKDDVDGVCALYPVAGGTMAKSGCETTPCPSPFLCVAGECQRPHEPRDVCSPCQRVTDACEAAGDDARCIDIGGGANAGRVCGRGCTGDVDCGSGFRCVPTSTSGDLQCVSDDGCRNGASTCATDVDCKESRCIAGACLGPADVGDAGRDAATGDAGSADAGAGHDAGAPLAPGGGGCSCAVTGGGSPSRWLSITSLFAALGGLGALVWRAQARSKARSKSGRS